MNNLPTVSQFLWHDLGASNLTCSWIASISRSSLLCSINPCIDGQNEHAKKRIKLPFYSSSSRLTWTEISWRKFSRKSKDFISPLNIHLERLMIHTPDGENKMIKITGEQKKNCATVKKVMRFASHGEPSIENVMKELCENWKTSQRVERVKKEWFKSKWNITFFTSWFWYMACIHGLSRF